MRLIDADALKEEFRGWLASYNDFRTIGDIIDEAHTIDVEPVRHGRWEWHETWSDETPVAPIELVDDGWRCSACGISLMQYLQSHFTDIPSYAECASDEMPTVERCPNCGAKMAGGHEDEK